MATAVSEDMRHALLLGLSALALSVSAIACSADAEDGSDGEASEDALSLATGFDVNAAKAVGRKVTDHGKGDTCVALKRLQGASYDNDDEKKEDKLCSFDFYTETKTADDQKPVVLCPKLNSTNPGTNVYELPDGKTKASMQSDAACLTQDGEKIGKFKQSLWCGHTGAVLAAYHVSRALGDIAGVPAAVLRTMDKPSHRVIVDQGGRLTTQKYGAASKTFIKRNWNALWPCLHDGRSDCGLPGTPSENLYIRGPVLWDAEVATSNFKTGHLVGAFMANASEDGKYPNITTQASVKANKRYQQLAKTGSPGFAKAWDPETVQGLLAMKDISDFLILDTIIEQQDRFSDSGGNLSQKKYNVWMDASGEMHSERADKKKDAPDNALTVARMVIEDNDCGLRKGMRRARGYDDMIAGIHHLDPSTYKGLQNLAKTIDSQKDVFTQGMAMSNNEFARLSENVKFVAGDFAAKCQAGTLTLDLDVESYIKGETPSCK